MEDLEENLMDTAEKAKAANIKCQELTRKLAEAEDRKIQLEEIMKNTTVNEKKVLRETQRNNTHELVRLQGEVRVHKLEKTVSQTKVAELESTLRLRETQLVRLRETQLDDMQAALEESSQNMEEVLALHRAALVERDASLAAKMNEAEATIKEAREVLMPAGIAAFDTELAAELQDGIKAAMKAAKAVMPHEFLCAICSELMASPVCVKRQQKARLNCQRLAGMLKFMVILRLSGPERAHL